MVSWKFLEVVPLILFFCIFTGILIFLLVSGIRYRFGLLHGCHSSLICIWAFLMVKYVSGVLTLWCFGSVWVLVRQTTLTFGIWIFWLSLCVFTAWVK